MSANSQNVRNAFDVLRHMAQQRGVPNTERWTIKTGSATFGRSWGIEEQAEGGGRRTVVEFGQSRQGAYDGMWAMIAGLELISPQSVTDPDAKWRTTNAPALRHYSAAEGEWIEGAR